MSLNKIFKFTDGAKPASVISDQPNVTALQDDNPSIGVQPATTTSLSTHILTILVGVLLGCVLLIAVALIILAIKANQRARRDRQDGKSRQAKGRGKGKGQGQGGRGRDEGASDPQTRQVGEQSYVQTPSSVMRI